MQQTPEMIYYSRYMILDSRYMTIIFRASRMQQTPAEENTKQHFIHNFIHSKSLIHAVRNLEINHYNYQSSRCSDGAVMVQ